MLYRRFGLGEKKKNNNKNAICLISSSKIDIWQGHNTYSNCQLNYYYSVIFALFFYLHVIPQSYPDFDLSYSVAPINISYAKNSCHEIYLAEDFDRAGRKFLELAERHICMKTDMQKRKPKNKEIVI